MCSQPFGFILRGAGCGIIVVLVFGNGDGDGSGVMVGSSGRDNGRHFNGILDGMGRRLEVLKKTEN